MTLAEAERQAVDLTKFSAAHAAVSHPFALARMTKIVMPKVSEDEESEILSGEAVPLVLWDHQREIIQAALQRRRIVVLKARQLGVTWAMALFALWYAIAHPASDTVIVSIGEREAKKVGQRIRWLYDHLPEAVRAAFPIGKKNTGLEFSIGHRDGEGTITSLPSSSTAGRGETVNLLILDEAAHWDMADDRLASLLPTVEDVGQLIMASTANGVGGAFYRTWIRAEKTGILPIFVKASARPDRDEEWVRNARSRVAEGIGVQEYPETAEEAFLSSGRCAFDVKALGDYLANRVRPPKLKGNIEVVGGRVTWEEDRRHGPWEVWRWREPGRSYLIAADVCGGAGGNDFSSAGVWDMESWDQVAAYHGRPEPTDYATILIRAGWMWRSDHAPALLAPEANDHGRAVLAVLRERQYRNLWQMARYDQRRNTEVAQFGWLTTSQSRPIMLAALKEGIKDGTLGMVDAESIEEMLTFEVNPKRNKEEAREGHFDDRVMMNAIAAAVLLREASGARPRKVTAADLQPYRKPKSRLTSY